MKWFALAVVFPLASTILFNGYSGMVRARQLKGPDTPLSAVVRQREFDVSIGQCGVSDRDLACTILIRHKILSDGEVKVCLLPQQLYVLLPVVRECRIVDLGLT